MLLCVSLVVYKDKDEDKESRKEGKDQELIQSSTTPYFTLGPNKLGPSLTTPIMKQTVFM